MTESLEKIDRNGRIDSDDNYGYSSDNNSNNNSINGNFENESSEKNYDKEDVYNDQDLDLDSYREKIDEDYYDNEVISSFNLPYTLLKEPNINSMVFRSNNAYRLWNDPIYYLNHKRDLKDNDGNEGNRDKNLNKPSHPRSFDNSIILTKKINELNSEYEGKSIVSYKIDYEKNKITITFKGSKEKINDFRMNILKSFCKISVGYVGIDTNYFLDVDGKIKQQVFNTLNEISSFLSVSIFVTNEADNDLIPNDDKLTGNLSNKSVPMPYNVYIYGDYDSVEAAKLRVNLLMDDISGKFIEQFPFSFSLIPSISGRMNSNFKRIIEWTHVNIYYMNSLPNIFAPMDSNNKSLIDLNNIYITGLESQVEIAKYLINDLFSRTKIFIKEFAIPLPKLNYILLYHLNEIKQISSECGTTIQVPFLGSSKSIIRCQSSSEEVISIAIQKIIQLSTTLYNTTYWVHEDTKKSVKNNEFKKVNKWLPPKEIPPSDELLDSIQSISDTSNVDITYGNGSFEIIGTSNEVKKSVSMIRALPYWPTLPNQLRFRCELPVDQREFISGKKNGKMIRIMKATQIKINFLPFTDLSFFIDLKSDDYSSALTALQLLEDEFPSEVSFYIPEPYHKHIIGTKGQAVQVIMRKYNVFVKFSNTYSQVANGGSLVRIPNVVIRCPAKNASNILLARKDLEDIVTSQNNTAASAIIRITRHHQRILLYENNKAIPFIEQKTGVYVKFPESDDDNDFVPIKGLGDGPNEAALEIKSILPIDFELKLPFSPNFEKSTSIENSQFWLNIIAPFWIKLQVQIQVYLRPKGTTGEPRYHRIILSVSKEKKKNIEIALNVLIKYLESNNIEVNDRGEFVKRDPIEKLAPVAHGSSSSLSSMSSSSFFNAGIPSGNNHLLAPPIQSTSSKRGRSPDPYEYDYRKRSASIWSDDYRSSYSEEGYQYGVYSRPTVRPRYAFPPERPASERYERPDTSPYGHAHSNSFDERFMPSYSYRNGHSLPPPPPPPSHANSRMELPSREYDRAVYDGWGENSYYEHNRERIPLSRYPPRYADSPVIGDYNRSPSYPPSSISSGNRSYPSIHSMSNKYPSERGNSYYLDDESTSFSRGSGNLSSSNYRSNEMIRSPPLPPSSSSYWYQSENNHSQFPDRRSSPNESLSPSRRYESHVRPYDIPSFSNHLPNRSNESSSPSKGYNKFGSRRLSSNGDFFDYNKNDRGSFGRNRSNTVSLKDTSKKRYTARSSTMNN